MSGADRRDALVHGSALELAARLARREVTSVELVEALTARIAARDGGTDGIHAVLAVAGSALGAAQQADAERAAGIVRSPLHGIPLLVKDNIETAGEGATAGSPALAGSPVAGDAACVARLREAGAVVLAKTNLSEWANFRGRHGSSGWSSVGGQTRNPHALDRSPGGSSSGSAAGLAAGYAPLALGTETDGSIVCPASMNGVVGLKPTHGLIAGTGVVPLARSQDTIGPMARTVADVALLLDGCVGAYADGGPRFGPAAERRRLDGLRVGVARTHYSGNGNGADGRLADALEALVDLGATIVDPADVETALELAGFADELLVLECELSDDLSEYLARRNTGRDDRPRSLAELVTFNASHPGCSLDRFDQSLLEAALATGGRAHPAYAGAFARNRERARARGLDATLARAGADALIALTIGPAWCIDQVNGDPSVPTSSSPAAVAGYPALSVPIGQVAGLPVGATLMAGPGAEALLLGIGAALEGALGPPSPARFAASVPIE